MSDGFIKITGSIFVAALLVITIPIQGKPAAINHLYFVYILGQLIPPISLGSIAALLILAMKRENKPNKTTVFAVTCIVIAAASVIGQATSEVNRTVNTLKKNQPNTISASEASISGKGIMDGNTFKGSIYNGSDKYWIKEIIITINHKDGTSRDYKINHFPPIAQKLASSKNYFADRPLPTLGGIKYSISPLDSGSFSITTFDTTSKNYDSWYIKSVKVEVK
ncbi:hypothetical protein [Pseudoalteromonas sp. Z9A5]|uniref:hypothetical protein n=1 Tax=Pseudoalteromonas sp. Z9A5 TaxID=2686355 RepID=UPI0014086192|nr:hypothetical protein [Pseudoalteromonas sp. Z9A5]